MALDIDESESWVLRITQDRRISALRIRVLVLACRGDTVRSNAKTSA